jgi:hypothetical protein
VGREAFLSIAQAEIAGVAFILIWFGLETLWDQLRSVVLPLWLVLPPVILGIVFQAVFGKWYIAGAMAAAIFLHLSNLLPVRMLGTLLLFAASALAHNWVLAAGFVLYWGLWELNIAGGADALAAYAALMIIPRMEMFWSLLAGIFVWAVVSMVVIYRGKLVERWKRLALRVFLRQLPTENELVAEGKPTIGGIWVGTILFALWSLLSGPVLRS